MKEVVRLKSNEMEKKRRKKKVLLFISIFMCFITLYSTFLASNVIGAIPAVQIANLNELVMKLTDRFIMTFMKEWWKENMMKPPTFVLKPRDIIRIIVAMREKEQINLKMELDNILSNAERAKKEWNKVVKSEKDYKIPSAIWAEKSVESEVINKKHNDMIKNYTKFLTADQAYMEDVVKNQDFEKMSMQDKTYMMKQIKNVENAKQSVSDNIISASATLKTVSNLRKEMNEKIKMDNLQVATEAQVLKDMVQLMYLNNQLLIELIRIQASAQLNRSAIDALTIDTAMRDTHLTYKDIIQDLSIKKDNKDITLKGTLKNIIKMKE